jgi:hypothetical protein
MRVRQDAIFFFKSHWHGALAAAERQSFTTGFEVWGDLIGATFLLTD